MRGDFPDRIDGVRRRGADRGADEAGHQAGFLVRLDLAGEGVGTHGEVAVHFDQAQVVGAEAGDFDGLLDGRMRLGGGIRDQAAVAALAVAVKVSGALAGGKQGAQRGTGSGVLDHAPARGRGKEFLRQAQHGHEPVEHMGFQFGAGGAGGPQHALHAESGGNEIAENRRPGRVRRKIGIEVGRLPVGDAGKDEALDVAENLVERLALLRRMLREPRADLAGLNAREHREAFDAGIVIGNPVHDRVALAAEFVGGHVE